MTLHYISRTKRDKELFFQLFLIHIIRSKILKSEISIFIIMGGIGGQIPPRLQNRNFSFTLKLIDKDQHFFIYALMYISYIIIPIKYKNLISKSPGFIGVQSFSTPIVLGYFLDKFIKK